jgi:hypothetical protein
LVDLRKQTVTFKSLECHKNSWKNGISGILKKNETTKIQIRLINSKAQYKNWRGIIACLIGESVDMKEFLSLIK